MHVIDSLIDNRTEITSSMGNKKWVVARPINYRYRTLKERIIDSWWVLTGKADAVTFIEQ